MVAKVCDLCGKKIKDGCSHIEYKEIYYTGIDCFSARDESETKHICDCCKHKCLSVLLKEGIVKRFIMRILGGL